MPETPSFVIPGNHDCYVPGSDAVMRHVFGDVMRGSLASSALPVFQLGAVGSIIGCNPCRPILLESSGLFPTAQLASLSTTLAQPNLGPVVLVATHYPVLTREGEPYHIKHPKHGVRNGGDLIECVRHHGMSPHIILHGHDHHGFHTTLGTDITPLHSYRS